MTDIKSKNFFTDNELLAEPYEYLHAMRDACPVLREPNLGVVMVTGYDEVLAVYNDVDRFSSCTAVTGPFPGFPVPLEGYDDITDLIAEHRDSLPMSDQLPTMDPPLHTANRALLSRMLTPKRLKENEDMMAVIADRVFDEAFAVPVVEWVNSFAQPYALLVIADLLGVPESDNTEFRRRMLSSGGGVGSSDGHDMAQSPLAYLYAKFSEYIADRRANLRGDVLTGLAAATFPDGSTPEVIDVVRVAANVFAAGQETTVRLLGSAVWITAEDPELQSRLRANRELVPNFLEECLRFESPIRGDFRLSKVPVTVGGVDLPAGTTVMLLNAAANRDPRKFADPDAFDIERENARAHLAFGRGIHTCPGAPLVRAEAVVSFNRLLDRTASFWIDEEHHGPKDNRRFQHIPTFILRGLTRLYIGFTPADSGS